MEKVLVPDRLERQTPTPLLSAGACIRKRIVLAYVHNAMFRTVRSVGP